MEIEMRRLTDYFVYARRVQVVLARGYMYCRECPQASMSEDNQLETWLSGILPSPRPGVSTLLANEKHFSDTLHILRVDSDRIPRQFNILGGLVVNPILCMVFEILLLATER